ncbi:MAG: transhydrogenase alpha subunit [Alphaproteobacteria bacterium]|nr:transhydrogenase alpha subunit [Alphaproteobacteria bacterium]
MKICCLSETAAHEARVSVTPDIAKRYIKDGFTVIIQTGAGLTAGYPDEAYVQAGAAIAANAAEALAEADLVLKVQAPSLTEINAVKTGAALVCLMDPHKNAATIEQLAAKNITAFGLELVPRTTRAQAMDVLSSQANLAGYRSVLEAAHVFPRAFPMFMTAAGTIAPARVFVMGAGVAGLQAIATAKRLGAIVSATDVRAASKEQVESLGASFVMVEDEETKAAETSGGYAKEMSEAYKAKQAALVADHIKKQDIVICTALIPGRPAPVLVSEEMLKSMKTGSVIVDLAVSQGGNCPLSECDKVIEKHGVTLVGYSNLPARVAADASALYARNVQNFVTLIVDAKGPVLNLNWADDIVKATGLTHGGKLINPRFGGSAEDTSTSSAAAA